MKPCVICTQQKAEQVTGAKEYVLKSEVVDGKLKQSTVLLCDKHHDEAQKGVIKISPVSADS
ncbi:hypothetical protein M1512_03840 [Patescibacteria group bacterium]|jgi:hypothetical protein|nr:hypothetical protein [Patescibacteria group bacterium]